MSEQQLLDAIGKTTLKTNKDLADAYAKLRNIDTSNLTFKGNKYIDDSGNAMIDVSSSEQRGRIRNTIFNTIANAFDDQSITTSGEQATLDTLDIIKQLQDKGREAGEKFGADFSQATIDYLSSKGKNFDLSSQFARLDPEEIKGLKQASPQEIQNMLGLTDEALQEFGVGTAEQAAQKFQEALENYR